MKSNIISQTGSRCWWHLCLS